MYSRLLTLIGVLALSTGFAQPDNIYNGRWRVVLDMPGGGLPFFIDVEEPKAAVRNGEEALPFTTMKVHRDKVEFVFAHYNSRLEGRLDAEKRTIIGEWFRRRGREEKALMKFIAYRDQAYRFPPIEEKASPMKDVSGEWKVTFGKGDGAWESLAVFEQEGTHLLGTFLTTVGDFRFLEGSFESGTLRLSVFDGAHAFLFHAVAEDKDTLKGDWWSGNNHTPWTAVRGGFEMPDPYALTEIVNHGKTFSFRFLDVHGKMVSSKDPRFQGKPMVVCILGTWCPNCHDEGAFLAELHDEYHDRGLEMVSLANEFAEDFKMDSEMIKRFAAKYGIEFPMLIVGPVDKKKTAQALSDLNHVLAYPTTLFIDRNGVVRKIHTGFTGPGTGKYHDRLRAEYREMIEEILK